MSKNKTAVLKTETLLGLKALRRGELDETIDDVVQRLLRFYLKKGGGK